jgi:hypothetical protein
MDQSRTFTRAGDRLLDFLQDTGGANLATAARDGFLGFVERW